MSVYINEFDPRAAAWLRELMKRGIIADGVVDERSILDVRPDDLAGFTQCHFFGGIGGWLYALRLAGWPDDKPVWTGSPPCQPFSSAGRQLGKDDARHLAPHFVGMVRACRPGVLFGEQVASADVFGKAASSAGKQDASAPQWAWIDDLSDRLEAAHYAIGASDFPSAGIGAPHIRQRTFFGAVDVAVLEHAAGNERMANHDGNGRDQGRAGFSAPRYDGVFRDSATRGVGDSIGARLEGLGGNGDRGDKPGRDGTDAAGSTAEAGDVGGSNAPDGFWSDPDWIFCRDGKWRPVEPAVLGLADGLPGAMVPGSGIVSAAFPLAPKNSEGQRNRQMRLKGYGNAINPHAAAAFIGAFSDAMMEAAA